VVTGGVVITEQKPLGQGYGASDGAGDDAANSAIAMSLPSHDLHLNLPPGHWQALQKHCAQTGENYSQVIRRALADYLDL
jgi:hypothetical protein